MAAPLPRRRFLKLLGCSTIASGWPWSSGGQPPASPARALVLGAGLSGLYAAHLLEAQGWRVTVLEARDRVGGRVATLDLDGPVEVGAQVLSPAYTRLQALARRLGVPVETARLAHGPRGECSACHKPGSAAAPGTGPGSTLVVGGRTVLEGDWSREARHLSDFERQVPPARLLGAYLARANPLRDATSWLDPAHEDLDRLTLDAFLAGQGATPEARRLMNVAPNCRSLSQVSALWALRDDQRRRAGGGLPQRVAGGNRRLPESLAGSLTGPIHRTSVVTALATGADGVAARCADGRTFHADVCVCTLPLPALRRVAIDPPLEGPQRDAVEQIPYTAITQAVFTVTRPFWQEDGLPVSMWTDTPIERVFPLRNAEGEVAGLLCFVDGEQAERLDEMDEDRRRAYLIAELERVRPAARGAVRLTTVVSWARDVFAGGAYHAFAPGQIGRLRPALARPWGRIHFAGEHTSVRDPGMEGALESAERAVAEIQQRYAPGRPA